MKVGIGSYFCHRYFAGYRYVAGAGVCKGP